MGGSLTPAESSSLRLAAVGDLLLASDATGTHTPGDPSAIFAGVRPLLADCDVVFGNLECTLAGDGRTIPTQPRVISTPEMVRAVRSAGFNVVTLANNHMFDCLQGGFHRLRDLLEGMGIAWFGAGDDLAEAIRPAVLEVNGRRLGFLGAVDKRSGPFQFAAPGRWGVSPLDVDRLVDDIGRLRGQVDHVIVSVHWGEERFLIPSPSQREQARRFAQAGASLVLGHHPHVLQGLERVQGVPVAYSLGNFVACEVPYTDGDRLTWNRTERTGCILLADLATGRPPEVRQIATFSQGQQVSIDATGFGDRRIAQANRALTRGVTLRRYRREHLWVKTVRPALDHLRWSKLKHLRLRQIRNALASLARSRRAQ